MSCLQEGINSHHGDARCWFRLWCPFCLSSQRIVGDGVHGPDHGLRPARAAPQLERVSCLKSLGSDKLEKVRLDLLTECALLLDCYHC